MNNDNFYPRRVALWVAKVNDLSWPEPLVRDRIKRKADSYAEAGIDTAIQSGFHLRFDLAPYFGLIHGYLADVAENLHERGIKFLDHYSCNLIARPRGKVDLFRYHDCQRHHVGVHPDVFSAESFSYAGFRINDLRELDIETNEASYNGYQAESLCHNNPNFIEMHRQYLKRQISEIPIDGMMADDMCIYAYFRSCGCMYCRERFKKEYGHDLPPISDSSFWGDTSTHPTMWGNYENPAFRDWVKMRYKYINEHLKMVKETLGPDKYLLTCCSNSAPILLNSLGLSYENFIEHCDWVMMENCSLSVESVKWNKIEPEAMLHKAVAEIKNAPALAASYMADSDGAYLGWAMARFWGITNWACPHVFGVPEGVECNVEEDKLIKPFNQWEIENSDIGYGEDVIEVRIVFVKAVRDNGWRDEKQREHWDRVRAWSEILISKNVGYRFVLSNELADAQKLLSENAPLILDGCSHLNENQINGIKLYISKGGQIWIISPLGGYDENGFKRSETLLDELASENLLGENVVVFNDHDKALSELTQRIETRIKVDGKSENWAVRLRIHEAKPVFHILNKALKGTEHPVWMDRHYLAKVLQKIEAMPNSGTLEFEFDCSNLPICGFKKGLLLTPDFIEHRNVKIEKTDSCHYKFTADVEKIKLYACIELE